MKLVSRIIGIRWEISAHTPARTHTSMCMSSSARSHTCFLLTVPGPGGIKLLKSGSQVLECLLLRQRQRCSHTVYITHDELHGRDGHGIYWSLATRLHVVLVPWRASEGGRQSGKGWRYLRWTFRTMVFSMKKEECEGFDSSTHSFTHSLLHSFTPHSFIQTLVNALLHMFTHWTRGRKNWWGSGGEQLGQA